MRAAMAAGRLDVQIEDGEFSLAEHQALPRRARPRAIATFRRARARPSPPSARPGRRAASSPARSRRVTARVEREREARTPAMKTGQRSRRRGVRGDDCLRDSERTSSRAAVTRRRVDAGCGDRGGRPARGLDRAAREAAALAEADGDRRAASRRGEALPLAGVTFAVKDNIDVAGLPTTAACPAFAYTPDATRPRSQRLVDAGAIVLGKTNLDQFATGLVGTRTPYGAVRDARRPEYVCGGSSSGSAVAVALGHRRPRARHRHRRLRPRARRVPGHRRHQADRGAGADHRRRPRLRARSTACRSSPPTWRRPSWRSR